MADCGQLKLGNNETTTDDASAAEVVEGIERKNTEAFYGHAKELQWAFNNIIGTYLLFGKCFLAVVISGECLFLSLSVSII